MAAGPQLERVKSASGVRPFLKWPGGKRWLIELGVNVPRLSTDYTYCEPFLGAGALFFALRPQKATLSDINPQLVAAFRGLKHRHASVIAGIKALDNSRATYERVRRSKPSSTIESAIRFIYLNRTAYAGLYRENRRGEFNVPFGNYSDRLICQEQVLANAAAALRTAELSSPSFEHQLDHLEEGDFVYLDPPYITGHRNNGFARYNRHLFTWEQQTSLALAAQHLADRGVHVLASNASHDAIARLYTGFEIVEVKRGNSIASAKRAPGQVTEFVISSYKGAVPPRKG